MMPFFNIVKEREDGEPLYFSGITGRKVSWDEYRFAKPYAERLMADIVCAGINHILEEDAWVEEIPKVVTS